MKTRKEKKQVIPLPFFYYFFTVASVALVGLFSTIYLAVSHFRVYTDLGYQSFCAISHALNCDTVSQSPYSILMGIPVAIWGIIGYVLFLWLLAYAWQQSAEKKRIWTLLFLISLGFTVYSVILAFISSYIIHSYCLMCIVCYAVNLLLLYFTWMVRNRFECEPFFKALLMDIRYLLGRPVTVIPGASFFCGGLVLLFLFMPAYWEMDPPELSSDIPTGMTEDGHPWIGAENPELVIVEFSDYRCFQCKKMHYHIRGLISDYPDKIRLVHRHFPMDHTINPIVDTPFHQGSAKLAVISIFAAEMGKFWEMNDLLYNIPRHTEAINIQELSEQASIPYEKIKYVFRDQQLWNHLKRDIRAGLQYNLSGTPGFVIEDNVYIGQIPPGILRERIAF